MAKIVSFANQKGGVGKTTTCVNVASYIAAMGSKVLIIDLDPQGNASSGLGVQKNSETKTIYNCLDGDCTAFEAILPTTIINMDIIPATVHLAGAEIDLVQMSSREKILKGILAPIKSNYDFIFIDCAPSLGLLTVNALTASDTVLIPIQCEFYALEGLTQLMNTVKLVREHLNNVLGIEGVVLTMKDNRSNLISQVSEEITKFFKAKVYNTAIPRNIRLAEAPSHGEPIIVYDASSKGGVAYMQLAEEFLQRNNVKYTPVTKQSKFYREEK